MSGLFGKGFEISDTMSGLFGKGFEIRDGTVLAAVTPRLPAGWSSTRTTRR